MAGWTDRTEFVVPYAIVLGLAFLVLWFSPPTLRTLGHIDPSFTTKSGQLTGAGSIALLLIVAGLAATYAFAWIQAGWIP